MQKKKAVTLIELIIYLAIIGVVLVLVIDLVSRTAKQQSQGAGQGEVNANGRFVVSRLLYSIQNATDVTGNYPSNTLSLSLPDSHSVTYSLNNGQLFISNDNGTATALTDGQVTIAPIGGNFFKKVSNNSINSIQISFRITYKQNNFSRDFQTAAMIKGK